MGPRVRRTAGPLVAVLLLTLSPVLAACGGDDEPEAASTPRESTTSTTPSPSPTRTEEPLSEFEDEAPVKVLRKYLALSARAVNKGDAEMTNARGVMSARGGCRRCRSPSPRTWACTIRGRFRSRRQWFGFKESRRASQGASWRTASRRTRRRANRRESAR